MIKQVMDNGLSLIYKKREGNLSSIAISLEAGANCEVNFKTGLAHVVEHMIYKGTENRTEAEINILCDEILGFNNAMTNYPYAVYYGTTLSDDFERTIELYSDLLINPIFPKEGFKEEIDVILEELQEWKEDPYQYCEDELLRNAFNSRRIKELIIGNKESVTNINIEDIKEFYKKYYTPENTVISVVSSLGFEEVLELIKKYFSLWTPHHNEVLKEKEFINKEEFEYEGNNCGVFRKEDSSIKGCKIQYAFPIHTLTKQEVKALRIFNLAFGEGTSSLLYDEIRTKNGLAYDISSCIKNEKGIKLFKISLGTSKDKCEKAINLINSKIEEVKSRDHIFTEEKICKLIKSFKLKRSLNLEKSIYESVYTANYEVMYGEREKKGYVDREYISPLMEEEKNLNSLTTKDIYDVIYKVLQNPTIEILSGKEV